MIPKAFIDSIIKNTNIEDLIGEYVELTPIGLQLRGACPFHEDKNSFNVSPDKQIWKCFKCNGGYSAIHFIEAYKKLSFPKAVSFLAERLQIEMPVEHT